MIIAERESPDYREGKKYPAQVQYALWRSAQWETNRSGMGLPGEKLIERFKPSTTPAPETSRECPHCLSKIPKVAKRCAFCTAEVSPATPGSCA